MYANGRDGGNTNGFHFYDASSDGSYANIESHSRSASGTSQTQYEDQAISPSPPVKSLVDTYASQAPLLNGGNKQARNGANLDSMSLHLLLETALGDSQHYDVLKPEELHELQKEEQNLGRQIEARKKKLFLETRLHATSQSLQRLDSRDQTVERSSICDELAQEIWQMEKRLAQLREKRLMHTAAVLQMNHQLHGAQEIEEKEYDLLDASFEIAPPNFGSRLGQVNQVLFEMISGNKTNQSLGFPAPIQGTLEERVDYTEQSLNTVRGLHDGLHKYLDDNRQKGRSDEQTKQRTDAVLTGLWSMIQPGEGSRNGTESPAFSLDAFSSRVQDLISQAANLDEQQKALHSQWQQERERSAQADSERDLERSRTTAELEETRGNHVQAQQELGLVKQQHQEAQSQLSALGARLLVAEDQATSHAASVQESSRELSRLISEKEDLQSQLALVVGHVEAEKQRATQFEEHAAEKTRHAETAESNRQTLEEQLVHLQTELTVVRAELDGAYGTRAQRAAELSPQQFESLKDQNSTLQRELGELVTAHEGMVKQFVEAEKERDSLESQADALRERVEQLEASATDGKIRDLGLGIVQGETPRSANSAGSGTNGGDSTSIGVVRAEFKKMMREMRADHFRNMRAEQEERRRLEALVRQLRAEHSSGTNVPTAAPSLASSAPASGTPSGPPSGVVSTAASPAMPSAVGVSAD